MSGDADFDFAERSRQYTSFESDAADSDEDDYRSGDGPQQHVSVDRYAGLTKKMVQKIAAIQQIAVDHDADGGLYRQMNLNSNAIKLSGQNFVTFYNTTMKNLDDGDLKYLYINPDKDAVLVQYQFDQIETVGSFKSNVHDAKSGYYTILLNNVYSNVSTGFNNQHTVIRPANFQSADAVVKTDAGAETQAFNDALEHKYLRELGHAVSVQVLKATDMGMIGQMKAEARKPMYAYGAGAGEKKGKLFDMRWTEDGVTMEMSGIGYDRLPEQAGQQLRFGSVAIQRKSETVYKTLFDFALYDLKWTSALAVQSSAGQRMIARSVDVDVPKAYVQVAITKSLNSGQQQQQLCGNIDADVSIKGFQFKINEDVPSELRSKIEQKFKRFFEHNLEAYVEESLKQEICYNGKY